MFRFFLTSLLIVASNIFSWEIALPGKVITTPIEVTRYRLVLICEDRRVYSIDSRTGSILWKIRPGGKLLDISESPDSTITILTDSSILSIYDDGTIRWKVELDEPSSMSIDRSGTIFVSTNNGVKKISRFGTKKEFTSTISSRVLAMDNSLIATVAGSKIETYSRSRDLIWSKELPGKISGVMEMKRELYISLTNGSFYKLGSSGEIVKKYDIDFGDPQSIYRNFRGDIVVKSGNSIHIINSNKSLEIDPTVNNTLYYSNGQVITTHSDWSLRGSKGEGDHEFYPSGWIQRIDSSSRGTTIRIWGDEKSRAYYRDIVKNGKRDIQEREFKDIEYLLKSGGGLGEYPNLYYFLLTASSYENPLDDCRREAYRLMGLTKDLIFKPFLLGDLVNERSYLTLPYIIYALGQIASDSNGEVMNGIVDRVDDYYDEKIAVNALYSLYYINEYYNRKYTNILYNGVERILAGGYSRKVENRCYDILETIK